MSSIDWLDLTLVPGLAGATGRLGMTGLGDAVALQRADGVDVLVSLVGDRELAVTGTSAIATFLGEEGVRVVRHPVPDMGVPADPDAFGELLEAIRTEVVAGRTVVVSCFGGYGRTGTAVACLLVDAGLTADEAIALVRATRPGTIEVEAQVEFVHEWATGSS